MPRNTLKLDTSGLSRITERLGKLGGDVQKAVTYAMTQAGEKISEDTLYALQDQFLPAGGKYHGKMHDTEESVIKDAAITWKGSVGEMPVGFDFSKPGAGGFLITGTPKMRPDKELNKMYKGKAYMRGIQNDMWNVVEGYVIDAMEGKA